jgi:hypothetical protein
VFSNSTRFDEVGCRSRGLGLARRLTDPAQLAHHAGKRAFDWLLDVAKAPNSHAARNNGRVQATSGAVASGVGRS